MKEWVETVQHMIDWIETHLDQTRMLHDLSEEIGYSPWYCSVLFHDVTNMTIKSYAAGRRLARAAEEIRDTRERILDIAVKYGYSSQEALSRVFKEQYGCTPAVYRRNPVPIRLQFHKVVLLPDYSETERITKMETSRLFVKVEHIPAHKYLGIWEEKAAGYGDFWNYHDESRPIPPDGRTQTANGSISMGRAFRKTTAALFRKDLSSGRFLPVITWFSGIPPSTT